ncbi:DUF6588 family protein [Aquimarina longa]|uniref:DUF6588 family protein n=1 Tax=Aquimarina longa TaxID=1080221 RepID=UPI00078270EC|nr:DUF6588 family protein [Aquimarina longa]
MKKCILLFALLLSNISISQTDINQVLEIGIENARRFSKDYFAPAGEVLVNAMSNGWYNSAKTKKLWHFEVGIVGNLSFVRDEKQTFTIDTRDYDGVTFRSGQASRTVSSALGGNQERISVLVTNDQTTGLEVVLPDGISSSGIGSIPSGFIQGTLGLIKSTEIKVRFLPRIKAVEDAEIQLYGIGFQHEFTDWVFPLKRWPVRLSGLLGYTNLKGFYDIDATTGMPGTDQKVQLNTNSWIITSVVSTKLPVLNFYGGLGYYIGSSEAELLGTYQIKNETPLPETLTDPIRVKNKTNGVKATIGAKVKYGLFRANLDYTLQNYNNLSLGLYFGW